ncbi:dehydrogenase [Clostridium polyendosporum]|uniref:Dehydrogenase n=1 Tax=Clostridium polyendosporum TaxID=69208 RepID=A0A919S0I2_9CLOT|nr:Gfo/Idh/MocA family oxidoreductase [Clostridium polyendosporum]GIM29990.1 dehydrogenase [Clostridium polyendosporum]
MRKIRWGIIGPGNIAIKFAQVIKNMDGVELEAVASRIKERAQVFGKSFDVPENKCYGSYEEILQDESIDAVYVAVPHTFHKDISIMCLKSGKATLCEKPVTISEEEIKEIVKTAEENKIFFMEAMKTRFLPVNQKVKQLINEGIIGDVRLLQADFGFKAPFDPCNRLFDKKLGGGALLDVGIYNVSYSSFIFGNHPVTIKSDLYFGKTGVDESASINLSYEDGKIAQLYAAINVNTIREANIVGTEGRICVPRFSNAESATIFINGEEKNIHMPFGINGFEYQIQEVVNCLNEGKLQSDIMSWKDSIEIMRIIDVAKNQ